DPAQIRVRRRIVSGGMSAAARSHCVRDLKEQRRRARAADKGRIAFAIKVSDPDCQNVMIEDRNRPCVVKALRGAGFPKDGVVLHWRAESWPWDLAEHFQGKKRSLSTNDLYWQAMIVTFRSDATQWTQRPIVRQGAIHAHEVFHRDLDASQRQGEPVK